MSELLAMIVTKIIMAFNPKAQRTMIKGCFKLRNNSAFNVYSGKQIDITPEEESYVRDQLFQKVGEVKKIEGIENGANIIKILLIIVIEIFIAGLIILPLMKMLSGVTLILGLLTGLGIMAIPPLYILKKSNENKNRNELITAIASGTIELFDYMVENKVESSTDSTTAYYLLIDDVSIEVSSIEYFTISAGEMVRCALVDASTGRYIIVINKSPDQPQASKEAQKKSAVDEAVTMMFGDGERYGKKYNNNETSYGRRNNNGRKFF